MSTQSKWPEHCRQLEYLYREELAADDRITQRRLVLFLIELSDLLSEQSEYFSRHKIRAKAQIHQYDVAMQTFISAIELVEAALIQNSDDPTIEQQKTAVFRAYNTAVQCINARACPLDCAPCASLENNAIQLFEKPWIDTAEQFDCLKTKKTQSPWAEQSPHPLWENQLRLAEIASVPKHNRKTLKECHLLFELTHDLHTLITYVEYLCQCSPHEWAFYEAIMQCRRAKTKLSNMVIHNADSLNRSCHFNHARLNVAISSSREAFQAAFHAVRKYYRSPQIDYIPQDFREASLSHLHAQYHRLTQSFEKFIFSDEKNHFFDKQIVDSTKKCFEQYLHAVEQAFLGDNKNDVRQGV